MSNKWQKHVEYKETKVSAANEGICKLIINLNVQQYCILVIIYCTSAIYSWGCGLFLFFKDGVQKKNP